MHWTTLKATIALLCCTPSDASTMNIVLYAPSDRESPIKEYVTVPINTKLSSFFHNGKVTRWTGQFMTTFTAHENSVSARGEIKGSCGVSVGPYYANLSKVDCSLSLLGETLQGESFRMIASNIDHYYSFGEIDPLPDDRNSPYSLVGHYDVAAWSVFVGNVYFVGSTFESISVNYVPNIIPAPTAAWNALLGLLCVAAFPFLGKITRKPEQRFYPDFGTGSIMENSSHSNCVLSHHLHENKPL